jgi:DNA-binding protein Fis
LRQASIVLAAWEMPMLFMVIERFRDQNAKAAYRRFARRDG